MSIKNPTPNDLAIYTAIIIALSNAFMTGLVLFFSKNFNWFSLLISTLFIAGISYFVVARVLKQFIYKRIRVIYKAIHTFKRSKTESASQINLRRHIIDEAEQEVLNWAKSNKDEIDDLKKLEEYRRNFLGNISHELKTPIFNIQGYLYTLIDGDIDDNQITQRYLNRAASNVERLNTIVQDLEQISRLEGGQLEMELHRFDVQALVQEIYDEIEIKAQENEIALQFKEGNNRAFHAIGDREQIRQVLTNLISNSVKYGKKGGTTRTGFYNMENQVLVEISDNGIGISEEHLPHLFDRFYRVDKGRSRNSGGTGLGLSIVKHIVEAHEQTINVRSRINVGSTFGFTLKKG